MRCSATCCPDSWSEFSARRRCWSRAAWSARPFPGTTAECCRRSGASPTGCAGWPRACWPCSTCRASRRPIPVRARPAWCAKRRSWCCCRRRCCSSLLFAFHRPLLAALYDPSFQASPARGRAAFRRQPGAHRVLDRVVRALCGAAHPRHRLGELFSLPLFAALAFAAGDALTLESVGVFWLVAFLAYTAFNCWALRRA